MDEHMGRRTVGGLLFTKGGSILLFREDGPGTKSKNRPATRHGCSSSGSRHSADKAKGNKELHRTAAVPKERTTPATPQRSSQIFKNPNRRPPHETTASSDNVVSRGDAGSENGGNRSSRDAPGRDLLARLKERVNASRKRSLARESSASSPSSSSNGLSSASSSPSSPSAVSRPSHRAASRIRKADEGPSSAGARRNGTRVDPRRRSSERSDDDLLLVGQITRDHNEPAAAAAEGFLSGFMARYRNGLQGALASLEDGMEDSNGYWRFDMGGTEELENYFIFNDRHRGMRMDIDGMSYEELLALGERIGTVNTGLSDDALSKCLNRSLFIPTTASSSSEDTDKKCSICQEEYLVGEEVAKMTCKHYYHISCIQHWLRQKNWCPICKSVALNTN